MGFKKFYNYYLMLESINVNAFSGRGIEIPTSTNPIVLVKNPIPSDVTNFPSVNSDEPRLKGFVDDKDLYIFDEGYNHEDITEHDSTYEGMVGINIIIYEKADTVMIAPSGINVSPTFQQQRIVEQNQVLKNLFPNMRLMIRIKTEPIKVAQTGPSWQRREGD